MADVAAGERLRVLVVDDDAVDRMAVRRALRATGLAVDVSEAEDGDGALAALLGPHASQPAPPGAGAPETDCVLLDFQLPGATGLDVLQALRAGGSDVPVVMLTGQSDPETAVALMKAGAADFIPKGSLTPDRLSRVVTSAVRLRRAERARHEAEAATHRALLAAEAAQHQAEEARARAEEANKAKSEFLAMMSHELRTPLNAIGGYVQLMQLGVPEPVPHAHLDYLERLKRSQQHLLGLINSVLNYAKLEAGRVEFAVEPVSVDELAAAVDAMVTPLAATRDLTYEWRPPAEPLVALADPEKAAQILLNLLSNAVKFTPPGGRVTLSAGRAGGPNGAERVALHVADTGIGIPAEKLETVFDPFVQLDTGYARQQEGTGLGLAISRDLARGMGGELSAASEVGQGATFTLTLRAADGGRHADRRGYDDRRAGDDDRRSHEERRGHLEPDPAREYLAG